MKTFTIAIGIMATFIIFVGYTVIYFDEKKEEKRWNMFISDWYTDKKHKKEREKYE